MSREAVLRVQFSSSVNCSRVCTNTRAAVTFSTDVSGQHSAALLRLPTISSRVSDDNCWRRDVVPAQLLDRIARMSSSSLELNKMTSTAAMTTELTTESENCTNYFCIPDDDYIDKIRDYVFPSTFEWVFVVLYAVVFIGGLAGNVDEALASGRTKDRPSGRTERLAGNALVCIVVWKNTPMRTVTNLFIVNLSTADLLVVLVCLPATVVGDITETWFVGRALCKLIHYLQVSRASASSSLEHARLLRGQRGHLLRLIPLPYALDNP